MLKRSIKKLAGVLLGEYAPYYIYRSTSQERAPASFGKGTLEVRLLDAFAIEAVSMPFMQQQAGYLGEQSYGFGCFDGDRLVGLCFYWYGDRYRKRNFWPLQETEAKLVQLVVLPEMRGRGIATTIIGLSAQEMTRMGFGNLYARVWYSNIPSLRAFQRAGWRRIAFVAEINPFRSTRPIRIHKKLKGA